MGEKEWSQVSKAVLCLVVETNTQSDAQRYICSVSLSIYQQGWTEKHWSMHAPTHITDRCEQHEDAHAEIGAFTHTYMHTTTHSSGALASISRLSHILSFCLVSLPAKRRKEDGQEGESKKEKNRASVFFLASVWRSQQI